MVDFLIILMYIALASTLGATAWAIYHKIRIVGKTSGKMHGIPVRRINMTIVMTIIAIMILSFIVGSTTPMHINATTFNDTFWLRTSNMFVFTGIMCIVAATCAMLYSYYTIIRKQKD